VANISDHEEDDGEGSSSSDEEAPGKVLRLATTMVASLREARAAARDVAKAAVAPSVVAARGGRGRGPGGRRT
jgi:hypothetical protein